ncbi:hypothetical protein PVAP13_3KG069800 [Panicum virgatum]|uniref:Uncharacterized protein n=1 Tax=Panicum virgatum TaxID=38727 RepID=A0A8T0UG25_PANVG|nr:hypothetical protein PVAP13_3KG069800 [Panicum virgatum]
MSIGMEKDTKELAYGYLKPQKTLRFHLSIEFELAMYSQLLSSWATN